MSTITDPIILDSTGQAIKNSIDLLSANINRTASNIPYDNNLTIKGKIDAVEDKIDDIDLTGGGTIVGNLTVNAQNGTTSAEGRSRLSVGNAIASGTDGNSYGMLTLYAKNTQHINISTVDSPTASRNIFLPDKAGTIAMADDVPLIENITSLFSYDTTYNVWATGQNAVAKSGYRFLGFQVLATNTNSPAVPACSFQNGYARIRNWDANYTFIAIAFYVKI